MNSIRQQTVEQDDAALLGATGLIQRSRGFSRPVYLAVIVGLALTTLGLGFAALVVTPAGTNAAIWWPAAGTSALLYLLYRGPRWQVLVLIGVIGGATNLLIGRPPIFAVWGIVVLVSEVLVFAVVLGPQRRDAMLGTVRGMLRFLAAVIAGAVAVGVAGGTSFLVLVGANPVETFARLFPSHLSALLLIVPIALVPLARRREGFRIELLVQSALIAMTVPLITQVQALLIGALLFPLFAWAAVRFRPIVVTVQLLAFSVAASVLAALGGAAFSNADVPVAIVLQVYLLSMALTTQSITVVRSERAELRAENQRQAGLLRGGFVGSQVGSMFVRSEAGGNSNILAMNDVAAELADPTWVDPLIDAWVASDEDDVSTEVLLDDGRTVQVYCRRLPTADGETVLGMQLVDITELVEAQSAMAHAVERERGVAQELRALAQQKDDFVSSVSHELRTPITSILGFAEELAETATPDQQQAAEIIMRNATRLTEMVEQLLEIGRMTSPNPLREARTIDLTMIARETMEEQSGIAHAHQVTITDHLSTDPTPVLASTNTAGRIVTNLLSNALKFTPPGGNVDITTVTDGSLVTLIVDDSGPGISDDDLPRVFERFFRSNDAHKRVTPGTGLGLSIVQSLVETHNGEIAISRSPLGGARVAVKLPASEVVTTSDAGPSFPA